MTNTKKLIRGQLTKWWKKLLYFCGSKPIIMNLSEKKALVAEQLKNIEDEMVLDGIIEYLAKSKTQDTLNVQTFFDEFVKSHGEVLSKLAQ